VSAAISRPDVAGGAREPATVVIVPAVGWRISELREVWAYRELLYFLAWKDLKLRYKQTVLGAGWALLQPLATTVVFAVFFGRLGGLPSDGIPYPLFAFAGLLPWTLFAQAVTQSSQSLVAHQDLVTKVYFPRLLVVLAPLGVALVDFAVAFVVLVAMMLWYGLAPSPALIALPAVLALGVLTAATVGVWLAAANVRYRDVRYVLPFVINLWLFASPVAYPASLVPERWRWLYGLNPMTGVIEGFRWTLLGVSAPPWDVVSASSAMTLLLLVGGLACFRHLERTFADVV
jgi:lipopolysaccharide transport system permease protein